MHTLPHSVPRPCSRPPPIHASPGDSWTLPGESGSVSRGVPAPFSWVLVHKVCLCPPRVRFPVLGKFSWLYGGVNGDLLPEGLCHTQVCGTQSPCPCGRPLLTCTSSGDTQTLKGRSGSVSVRSPCVHKVLCEPSEHPWQGFLMPFRPSYHLASCIIAFTGIRASLALRR